MFSVVIPVYNGEKFIENAIESVFAQDFDKWEIIIVDDGSADRTLDVLEKHKNNSKIHIYSQENQGVSAARNNGINHSQYPYIAFLDADDVWKENHLSTLNEMITLYPKAGMYCTFTESHTVDGHIIDECNFFKDKEEIICLEDFFDAYAKDKSAKMYTVISTCTAKEAAIKVGGFPVGCRIGEDLEFSLKISAYYPVVLSSKVTAVYQKTNSTATKDTSFDPDWHFFDSVNELYSDSEIPQKKKDNIRKVMQWFTIRRSRHYIIDGEKRKAVLALKSVGKTDLKKDVLLTKILLMLPSALVKKIFLIRWRSKA